MARLAEAPAPAGSVTLRVRTFPLDRTGLLLALIVVLGAVVRFARLDWDGGAYTFHPDEWALNQVVARLGPDGNPHFFFYGTFPIYLDRLTADALRLLTGLDWLAPARLPLIGRFYSALASLALLPLVFAVGRRLWGPGAGLLAAACTASAALLIQAAHFGTVDTAVALAGLLLLWAALRIGAGGGLRWYLLAGVVLGLAVATKLTAASLLLLPALAHLLRVPAPAEPGLRAGWRAWRGPLLLAGSAALALALAAPYYFLDWPEFWQAIVVQTDELSGGYVFPYTWQFVGSVPYLFELQNFVVWSLGLPLGLAVLAGWAWAVADCGTRLAQQVRGRRFADDKRQTTDGGRQTAEHVILSTQHSALSTQHSALSTQHSALSTQHSALLLVWPTLYFLYVGTWEARFGRHLLPLVPWGCLWAAGGLTALGGWLARRGQVGRWAGWAVAGAVLLGAGAWGLALFSIYTAPEPRTAATAWVHANVPAGSVLVIEDKNDLLPVPAFGSLAPYQLKPLTVTAPDTPTKMRDFAAALAAGDVLIVPNRRWAAVLPRLATFPATGAYYRRLLAGRLGYTPAATFADPPHLGPLAFPDDSAEETFQVFDHPTVRIFRNTGRLSEAQLAALLGAP